MHFFENLYSRKYEQKINFHFSSKSTLLNVWFLYGYTSKYFLFYHEDERIVIGKISLRFYFLYISWPLILYISVGLVVHFDDMSVCLLIQNVHTVYERIECIQYVRKVVDTFTFKERGWTKNAWSRQFLTIFLVRYYFSVLFKTSS